MLAISTLVATSTIFLYYTESNAQRELDFTVDMTNPTELEMLVHDRVNIERGKQDLAPLRVNSKLVAIARAYSQEMAKNNLLSHQDPQGKDYSDRYSDTGFTCRIIDGRYIYNGGENLYLIHLGKTLSPFGSVVEYYSQDELARQVVDGWMNSSGHRETILRDLWQSEGVGVSITNDGKIYVTQNFC